MITKLIEATNTDAGGINHGKFMVARFEPHEWSRRSTQTLQTLPAMPLLWQCGWSPEHILVTDLQTGEGAIFRPGGLASYDLNVKHRIWVCPLYERFLTWLYKQDLADLSALPDHVAIDDPDSSLQEYRRQGTVRADG